MMMRSLDCARDDRGEGGCLREDVIWMMWANVGSEEGGEGDLIRFLEKSGGRIWKYGEYCVPSQAVTTNHRCIWMPIIYEVWSYISEQWVCSVRKDRVTPCDG
jgi:hypothetical protein